MKSIVKIKKGLEIPIKGAAHGSSSPLTTTTYAVKPVDFPGVFPKMVVKEGDKVEAGSKLFFDKYSPKIFFTSPVSGTVKAIVRGAKRKLLEVVIEADGKEQYFDFGKESVLGKSREELVEKMLTSGVWTQLRQRPYNVIADPEVVPNNIYISTFDTAPLTPDYHDYIDKEKDAFLTGISALKQLVKGDVYLNVDGEKPAFDFLENLPEVVVTSFVGKHPAGNVGTQINHLNPINKGDKVWTLRPEGVVAIGKLFLEGKYDTDRVIAVAGEEVEKPQLFKVKLGASVKEMLQKTGLKSGNVRVISGNVLHGTSIGKEGYLGAYDNMISVITEGDFYRFFGWIAPGFHRYSFNRTFFSWLTPKRKYSVDTNLNGGQRAYVFTGDFERVFPFDIYPMQLLKAIETKDIDKMEKLGIYEVVEEDFALCEYIDVSKNNIQQLVREGLDLMRNEME